MMKPLCLQAYFLGCIPVMQKLGAGALIMDSNPTEIGGFKEVVFQICGDGVYGRMKFKAAYISSKSTGN